MSCDEVMCLVFSHCFCRCIKMRRTPKVAEDAAYHFLYAFLPRRAELALPAIYSCFVDYYDAVKTNLQFSAVPYAHFADGVRKALADFESKKCDSVDDFLQHLSTLSSDELSRMDLKDDLLDQVVSELCQGPDIALQDRSIMPNDLYFTPDEFRMRISNMSKEQDLVFKVVFKQMKLECQLLLFVTGGGGTGKSFLIQNLRELFIRSFRDKTTLLLCAPTGRTSYCWIWYRLLDNSQKISIFCPSLTRVFLYC